jgi:copper chaperone CopZ
MDHNRDCYVEPLEKPIDRAALERAKAIYLAVKGMGCPNCARRVNNSLLGLDGVVEASVYFEQGLAAVAYDPTRVDVPAMVQAVARIGRESGHSYEARLIAEIEAGDTYQQ